MAMLNVKLQRISKMKTEVIVGNLMDKVYVVILRISRVCSILKNRIHQCFVYIFIFVFN